MTTELHAFKRYAFYVRGLRNRTGLNQWEIAKVINCSQSRVSKIEGGEFELSHREFRKLERIARRSPKKSPKPKRRRKNGLD